MTGSPDYRLSHLQALEAESIHIFREVAAELEELGYGAIWIPDAVGRDPLVHATLLLGGTVQARGSSGDGR